MKPEWIYLFAGAITISAVGFVFVATLWLRKLREAVSSALTEAAEQQIRATEHLTESLAKVQKQQDNYNQQVQILAQAGMRLQQELSNVTHRLDNAQPENPRGGHTLH